MLNDYNIWKSGSGSSTYSDQNSTAHDSGEDNVGSSTVPILTNSGVKKMPEK
jgi:hypothetical protein